MHAGRTRVFDRRNGVRIELQVRAHNIETIESKTDEITHHTIPLLNQTFIRPLDHDEIRQLITRTGGIPDLMEDISQCMFLYNIRGVTDEATKLAEICLGFNEKKTIAVTHSFFPTRTSRNPSSMFAPRSIVRKLLPIK
jgi:uncharacterized protein Yka (UPF0111/DUF47 family)